MSVSAPTRRSPRRARRPLRSARSVAPLPHTRRSSEAAAAADPLAPWVRAQVLNLRRHAAALGPFRRAEFEAGRATVSEGHVQATNELIASLRRELLAMSDQVAHAARDAQASGSTPDLQRVLVLKERAHHWVRAIERIWDFYFELFTQRQSQFGPWLLSCDRIA